MEKIIKFCLLFNRFRLKIYGHKSNNLETNLCKTIAEYVSWNLELDLIGQGYLIHFGFISQAPLALYCFANSQISTALKLLYRARYLATIVCGENHPDIALLDVSWEIYLVLQSCYKLYNFSLRATSA